jgi:O-antigen/teichoic acid export membrane protein
MTLIKKYFLLDSFSNAVYFGSKFIFNIVVYSLLIKSFPLQDYGVYIFFSALMGQMEFIQSGFATSLQRFIPEYKNKTDVTNLVSLVGFIYLFIGITFSLFLKILNYFKIFDLLDLEGWELYVQYLIYYAPVVWFFKAFSFALKGVKDFRFENIINLIFLVVELILIYTMIQMDFALSEILFIVLLILLLKHIGHFIIFYVRHKFKFSLLNFSEMKYQFRKIKTFSFWNFILSLSGTVMNQFDKVLITIYLGPTSLPIYYGLSQFLKFYSSTLSVINSSVIPYFSEKVNNVDDNSFNQLVLKGTSMTLYIGLVIAGLLFLNSDVIFILISKEYLIDYTTTFNLGILLSVIIVSRSFFHKLNLCKVSQAKNISFFGLLTALTYPVVFWILITYFQIDGAILSPIVTHLLILPFWIVFFFKETRMKISKYLEVIFKGASLTFILISIFYSIDKFYVNEKSLIYILGSNFLLIFIFGLVDYKRTYSVIRFIMSNKNI